MRRLAAAMLAPELHEHLWRVPFRADCWPCYLEPVLDYVRHQREFSSRLIEANTLFVKEASSPAEDVLTRCPPGVSVRPLDSIHLDTVKRFWPYTAVTPDADGVMRDGMTVGLSVGVFVAVDNDVASSPDGELVCWVLLNRNAFLGFLHTLESHRRRGLARLAMAELTRLFLQRPPALPGRNRRAVRDEHDETARLQFGLQRVLGASLSSRSRCDARNSVR
ncbi:uncharacterized protein LOC119092905 [Pollicipes pollicipes]|uniref:uncharacterized protein LOC119092905 n=1 Tax=Pollicipes pollicipes TaxID=41117 RepID=UPI0018856D27|nr:uncharacterized protein LOC119092905 [Pollicipes pollicipes]